MNATKSQESVDYGVGYYNIDNTNKKDKTLQTHNPFSPSSSGLAADAALSQSCPQGLSSSQEREAEPQGTVAVRAPTPCALEVNQVKGYIIQLFDNGEESTQRYKLKIRLNLVNGTNPEFIAPLTKDMRNFKKHVPGPNAQEIIAMAQQERTHIKKTTGNFPHMGKFHLNAGATTKKRTLQVEPDTLALVWWDPENFGWSGVFKIQDFAMEFDLFTQYLTPKQKAQGVKAQDTWKNPKYDKTERPLTWAEQRAQGLA